MNGTTGVRKVWDGQANLLELVVDGPAGHFEGLSLRLYDPRLQRRSLNFSGLGSGSMSAPAIEQSVSADGGKTWDANWIAVDTRV